MRPTSAQRVRDMRVREDRTEKAILGIGCLGVILYVIFWVVLMTGIIFCLFAGAQYLRTH